jgi:hypothetical protein
MKTHIPIHRVDRSQAVLISGADKSSDFVDLPPAECVSIVWELTQELWSLTGDTNAEQRLQRNVAVLKRQ